jgi:hypothetical protein
MMSSISTGNTLAVTTTRHNYYGTHRTTSIAGLFSHHQRTASAPLPGSSKLGHAVLAGARPMPSRSSSPARLLFTTMWSRVRQRPGGRSESTAGTSTDHLGLRWLLVSNLWQGFLDSVLDRGCQDILGPLVLRSHSDRQVHLASASSHRF